MPGYSNPVITLRFDQLVDDPTNDPIWVAIKNPKVMPPEALRPKDVELDADGKPVNEADAMSAMYSIIAGLVIGWRAYDATDITIDAAGNVQPMSLLPTPATADLVRRLPMEIINQIAEVIRQAANPT